MVGEGDRLLNNLSKHSKDRLVAAPWLHFPEGGLNDVSAKTPDSMTLEIRRGGAILRILVLSDALCVGLAVFGSASKKVKHSAILILNLNF